MDLEQLISEMNAKHYDQIRKSLQVVISPKDITVNPNLTANLRADRELKAKVLQQQLSEVRKQLATAQQVLVKADEMMSRIPGSFFEINSAIADGLYHCKEAINQIDNHPQPDR